MKLQMSWKGCIGLLAVFAAVLIFISRDAFLYEDTVVKLTFVENSCAYEEEGPEGEKERYYEQKLRGRILNGDRKGEEETFSNTYSDSGVNDERFRRGDQIFVVLHAAGGGVILGRKRDGSLALLIFCFVFLLLAVNGWMGLRILLSLLINIGIFLLALRAYGQGRAPMAIAVALMLVFGALTLLFAAGFHKKTAAAVLASMVTVALSYGIYQLALHTSDRLPYEMMDYVVSPNDLSDLFFVGVVMGSLGAVMDVCISIAAGVAEILKQNPQVTGKALVGSIREMGYDIMGTMINVLFFSYLSSSIPIVVVKLKNGYTLYHMIQFQCIFDIIRFLMGAIGIVLAIPVSGFFSVWLLSGLRGGKPAQTEKNAPEQRAVRKGGDGK